MKMSNLLDGKMPQAAIDALAKKNGKKPKEKKTDDIKESPGDMFNALEEIYETATAGATSAGSVATVSSPHLAIGDKKTRKKYGTMGANPNPPKAKMQKPTDNALNMKNTSIFGGTIKRNA